MFYTKRNYFLSAILLILLSTSLFSQNLADEWYLEKDPSRRFKITQEHNQITMQGVGARAQFKGTIQTLDSVKLELRIPNAPEGVSNKILFKGKYYFGAEGGERLDAVFVTPQYDVETKEEVEPKKSFVKLIRDRSSDRIWNFTKTKEVELGDIEYVDSLYSGQKQLPGWYDRIHNDSKAVLIITDYKSSEAMMQRAEYYQVAPGEFKVWLHLERQTGWVLRSTLPQNAMDFMQISSATTGVLAYGWTDFLDDLGKGLDVVATGAYELMDWTSKGLEKLRIPEWVWNCDHKDYDTRLATVYKYAMKIFNPMMPIITGALNNLVKNNNSVNANVKRFIAKLDSGEVGFSFMCGIWNGVIEIGRSIPELGKLIVGPMSSKARSDFSNFLDKLSKFKKEAPDGTIACEGTWCAIKTGLGDAFNPLKFCKFAELAGEITLPLVIAFVGDPVALFGVAEAGAAKVIIQIIRVMQWIDKLGDPFQALGSTFRFVNSGLSRVRNSAGKIMVRIDNNIFKAHVLLEDEIRFLSKSIDEVALVPSGGPQLMAKFDDVATSGGKKTAKIIDGNLAKALQQKGISIRKLNKLGKLVDDIGPLMNRLNKTDLSNTYLNRLIDDLTLKPEFLKKFNSSDILTKFPDLVDSWKIVKNGKIAVRRSPEVLDAITKLRKKTLANGAKLNVRELFDNGLTKTLGNATDVHRLDILKKIDGWTPDQVAALSRRLSKPKYAGLADDLVDPDLFKLYDDIITDPENALDTVKTAIKGNNRLDRVAKSTFFREAIALGQKFENDMLNALKNKTSNVYKKLKELVPDLDDRKLLSQVQFCIPPGKKTPCNAKGEYFIADVVFVKYNKKGKIVDMIIADSKLSETTRFTKGQTVAKNGVGQKLAIRSARDIRRDALNNVLPGKGIPSGSTIANSYFYKIFGNGSGAFQGIN